MRSSKALPANLGSMLGAAARRRCRPLRWQWQKLALAPPTSASPKSRPTNPPPPSTPHPEHDASMKLADLAERRMVLLISHRFPPSRMGRPDPRPRDGVSRKKEPTTISWPAAAATPNYSSCKHPAIARRGPPANRPGENGCKPRCSARYTLRSDFNTAHAPTITRGFCRLSPQHSPPAPSLKWQQSASTQGEFAASLSTSTAPSSTSSP